MPKNSEQFRVSEGRVSVYHVRYTDEWKSAAYCDVEARSPAEALDVAKRDWGFEFGGYYEAYRHGDGHGCADEVVDGPGIGHRI